MLLSTEKGLKAEEIAQIVGESYVTVLRWLKRYMAEGIAALSDNRQAGRSSTELLQALLDMLIEASENFFTRFNQTPDKVLSIIGAH